MTTSPVFSILICTKDRGPSLAETLACIGECNVPSTMRVEVVVIDNGSVDGTPEIAKNQHLRNALEVRYVSEPRKGKGYAYNTGISVAAGEILLFTDDDVRVPVDWIESMTRPIIDGLADATTGEVHIAPQLERAWLTPAHRVNLLEVPDLSAQHAREPFLIGANMAFSRRVLRDVPGFEPALGPGALGFMDETLLYLQILEAGYRLRFVAGCAVEHHFDPDRLTRAAQLRSARAHGRSAAWVMHHWWHEEVQWRRSRMALNALRLCWINLENKVYRRPGFDPNEVLYAVRYWTYYELGKLRGVPRLYARRALRRTLSANNTNELLPAMHAHA